MSDFSSDEREAADEHVGADEPAPIHADGDGDEPAAIEGRYGNDPGAYPPDGEQPQAAA